MNDKEINRRPPFYKLVSSLFLIVCSACQNQPNQLAVSDVQKITSDFKIQTTASSSIKSTVLPTQIFQRNTGKPITELRTFYINSNDLNQRFILTLLNGPSDKEKVSSATVKLNGEEILSPKNFNQQVETLSLPIRVFQKKIFIDSNRLIAMLLT